VYEYDVAGRAWKVTHPDGGVVNTTYTPRGEVATTYGARSYPVEHTYDSHGRMKTLKTWQNKTAGTGVAVTMWTYDIYRGWLTAKKYEGRTTSVEYEYTPGGRLKLRRWERNASTGGRLVTTYRHGIPAESTLGLPVDGGLHRIEYGATTVGTPEVRYTYDRAGRRVSTRQFNGATELRRVDWQPDETGAFGMETQVESGATTFTLTRGADSVLRPGSLALQRTATNVLAMTYGYDTASRLTSVSDGTLSATYAYQANSDLLSTITLRNGATTRLTTTRVYDRWGRLQSQWAVANAASVQPVVGSGYTYNAAGQRIRQDLGDGTYWTYAYDSLGQLTGAQRRWPDGTLVAGQQYGYLYDDIGNRKQSQEGGDANGAGLQTTTYTANLLNQYSSITTPGVASVNGLANATNTVTVNGAATVRQGEYWWRETSVANASAPVWASLNVAASNGGTTNTTVNRYVPKASETPTYDDDGNQTGDGRWIYRWDAENRLVEMETTSTAITAGVPYAKVRWTYDPLGRRIQRESWQGASPVVVTRYVYDGWQCLAELDGSNAVTATYAWGLDLSGSRTGAGGVGGLLWANHTQHGRHFYSYDGNGNVCGLTSATDGTRTGGYEYDPFGGIIRANEPHPVAGWNEWQHSAKRFDRGAGLILFEYRHYSAVSGKWLSRDPLGERSSLHSYQAFSSSPPNTFDFLGLMDPLQAEANELKALYPNDYLLFPGPWACGYLPVDAPPLGNIDKLRKWPKSTVEAINYLGGIYGCHSCGEKNWEISSIVPDHQSAFQLNRDGLLPNKLYPHCEKCMHKQAYQVMKAKARPHVEPLPGTREGASLPRLKAVPSKSSAMLGDAVETCGEAALGLLERVAAAQGIRDCEVQARAQGSCGGCCVIRSIYWWEVPGKFHKGWFDRSETYIPPSGRSVLFSTQGFYSKDGCESAEIPFSQRTIVIDSRFSVGPEKRLPMLNGEMF
jgi:RHS repeat-associated protein